MTLFNLWTEEVGMRVIACAAAAFIAVGSVACGDRTSRQAGTTDTAADRILETPARPAEEVAGTGTAPSYAFEDREAFAQSVRDRLAQVDSEIERLAAEAKSAGGAVSDRALANARAARRAVDRRLARVNTATAENWEEIKRGVSEAVDHLAEAVERAYPK